MFPRQRPPQPPRRHRGEPPRLGAWLAEAVGRGAVAAVGAGLVMAVLVVVAALNVAPDSGTSHQRRTDASSTPSGGSSGHDVAGPTPGSAHPTSGAGSGTGARTAHATPAPGSTAPSSPGGTSGGSSGGPSSPAPAPTTAAAGQQTPTPVKGPHHGKPPWAQPTRKGGGGGQG